MTESLCIHGTESISGSEILSLGLSSDCEVFVVGVLILIIKIINLYLLLINHH